MLPPLNAPNLLSLSRLPLAAAFAFAQAPHARLAILCAAGVTDWLDGRLARRLDQDSQAGALLDPICDKLFAATALAVLLAEGALAGWEALVLLARDIATTTAFLGLLALRRPVRFRARVPGKAVTVLQVATLAAVTAGVPGVRILVLATGAVSAYAIADYARAAATSLAASRADTDEPQQRDDDRQPERSGP
jgi:cardiolipin synthase